MPQDNDSVEVTLDDPASGTLGLTASARALVVKAAPNPITVILAVGATWLIWGSTFLAIRYAVETIPPLYAAGIRHFLAGSFMLLCCAAKKLRPTRQQLRESIILGFFFFVGGHGLIHWAEVWVPSGASALLIATEPILVFLLADLVDRKWRMNSWLGSGVIVGLIGVALLLSKAESAGPRMRTGAIAVLLSALSWSIGVVYSRRSKLSGNPLLVAALAPLAGSFMLLIVATVPGEARQFSLASVTSRSWISLAYLIIFGSIITFTAYAWLLEHFSPTLVATHTYINPVIAVLLGWLVGDGKVTLNLAIAAALVISAVFLVQRGTGLLGRS
ncbi:MAG TPA: EamA family transporter [Candidatus Acidoferrales bacterium]|nr:EamA family transporter [Candidatus Acidoferrales bacterium]